MKKNAKIILAVIAVIVIVTLAFAAPLANTQVKKPVLATSAGEGVKPVLTSIDSENVNWVSNEVGAYKLNDGARIEIVAGGVAFTTTVNGHVPSTTAGSGNADVRFILSAQDFQTLYASSDMIAAAKQLKNEGKLTVEILKSEIELYAKGYGALYEELK